MNIIFQIRSAGESDQSHSRCQTRWNDNFIIWSEQEQGISFYNDIATGALVYLEAILH